MSFGGTRPQSDSRSFPSGSEDLTLSEVEGESGGSLVTGSEAPEEEVSGGGDGTSCPGEGTVPQAEAELRVAMVDGGLLRVHFSVTARTLKVERQCRKI